MAANLKTARIIILAKGIILLFNWKLLCTIGVIKTYPIHLDLERISLVEKTKRFDDLHKISLFITISFEFSSQHFSVLSQNGIRRVQLNGSNKFIVCLTDESQFAQSSAATSQSLDSCFQI